MHYIIFDLEWNNAYNYSSRKFMNEIIEIGAVKLDESLEIVDTFKTLVIPQYTKKLSSRCKRITKITNEEIKENGIGFHEAFRDFARWSGSSDNVFMSWSNSDLYVLANNFIENTGSPAIKFIRYYCDAQKYCMSFIHREPGEANNQISLAHCAEMFDIEVDTEALHRALADCYVTAECLRKVYDREKLERYIKPCDKHFFERLFFKPFYITQPLYGRFDVYDVPVKCPRCGAEMPTPKTYEVQNKSFKGATTCPECTKSYWMFIRAKKLYDDIAVKTTYVEMNSKKARRMRRNDGKLPKSGQRKS
ncbi:MAG: exonuclease domain-containing protein [Eubacterium sp.]|nr:exonuclease domain-containing protein [Eubacterium sp.]